MTDFTPTVSAEKWLADYEATRVEQRRLVAIGPVHDVRPPWCICHEGFYARGLRDPSCRHDEFEDYDERILKLLERKAALRTAYAEMIHANETLIEEADKLRDALEHISSSDLLSLAEQNIEDQRTLALAKHVVRIARQALR